MTVPNSAVTCFIRAVSHFLFCLLFGVNTRDRSHQMRNLPSPEPRKDHPTTEFEVFYIVPMIGRSHIAMPESVAVVE